MTKPSSTPHRWAMASALSALIGACAATPQAPATSTGAVPTPSPKPEQPAQSPAPQPEPQAAQTADPQVQETPTPAAGPVPGDPTGDPDAAALSGPTGPFTPTRHTEMNQWREDFSARARVEGRNPAVVFAILEGISPLPLYLSEDEDVAQTGVEDQAEFAKAIWEYLRTAVTTARFETGQTKLAELAPVFDRLEQAYGVDREVIAAIWAMETNYGSYIGDYDAANTLSNMAVEGRRRSFAESQLIALMKIVENGYATRAQLGSGWAGAMGQTQFMPTTYLAYAQDYDGNGKADLWAYAPDALASAANYLSQSGYSLDQPWGTEVLAPANFDWSYADGNDRRLSTWKALGLSPIRGGGFEPGDGAYAELWLPAGAQGPKYLLFKNFSVFKTYNRSNSYALAVGLLADGLRGEYGPVASWPTHVPRLTGSEVKTLQATLNQLGYDAGPVDGIVGSGTRGALQEFQKANGMTADGYVSKPALQAVLNVAG
ncbi:lytic murein transglycosylase [Henriciella sp.]|uniref:lytic murein transglycosylase n=1 Tax=Henriciella sp. TaxID=1968823 RepID=UPI002618756A|nr:lytic murein transglycosylase [Henriciella sp.]